MHKVESGSKFDSECSVASGFKVHLDEEANPTPVSPKKLAYPSQDIKNVPENLKREYCMTQFSQKKNNFSNLYKLSPVNLT